MLEMFVYQRLDDPVEPLRRRALGLEELRWNVVARDEIARLPIHDDGSIGQIAAFPQLRVIKPRSWTWNARESMGTLCCTVFAHWSFV